MNRTIFITLLVFTSLLYSSLSLATSSDTLTVRKLDEVLITSSPAALSKTENRLVFYPEKLAGSTAALTELFRFIPSIESDMDGNLSFRGSSDLTLLVNGRPAGMMGDYQSEVLVQYPTEAIERIEVNTSPSAAHISDGGAGVINIILKDGSGKKGGSASAGIANDTRYKAQTNYRTQLGAWSVSGMLAYKKEYRERSFKNLIVVDPQHELPTSTQQQNNTANARPQSVSGNLAVSYTPNQQNEWGADLSFFALQFDRIGRIHNLETPLDASKTKELTIIRDNNQKNRDFGISTYYNHLFSKIRSKLQFSLLFQTSEYDEGNFYTRTVVRPKPNLMEDKLDINRINREWLPAVTYVQPIGKNGLLESGYWLRHENSDHKNNKTIKKEDHWQEATDASFQSQITRNIHALFVQYQTSLSLHWNVLIGLRGEYSNRSLSLLSQETIPKQTDWKLLPSAQIAYQTSDSHSFSLSYNRRLNRPALLSLVPFTDQADPTHWLKGNPYLHPEEIDNLSLNYNFTHRFFSLSPTLFFRYRKNSIEMRTEAAINNQIITTFDNLYSTQAGGIELLTTLSPTRWCDLQVNATLYFNQIDAQSWEKERKKGDWVHRLQGVASFQLTPSTRLQIDGSYFSDRLTAQGRISSRYYVNTAIRQSFLEGKATVSLSVNDWFNNVQEITTIDVPNLYKRIEKQKDNQTVWLSAEYRF